MPFRKLRDKANAKPTKSKNVHHAGSIIVSTAHLYETKQISYFGNARHDIVDMMPDMASRVIEVGCGSGATGRLAKSNGKASYYLGIDIDAKAAELAAEGLDRVICGNIEEIDLSELAGQFDVLILSEVLEHLIDPDASLKKLASCLRSGGVVYASSPNVANYKVLSKLLGGHFDYVESGVMDRTHLRWFTPKSFRRMFEAAGFVQCRIEPHRKPGMKARLINAVTFGRFEHLFYTQMLIVGSRS